MAESWTPYLSLLVDSLHDCEELSKEIKMKMQTTFENILAHTQKKEKKKRGRKGRILSSLGVINEETSEFEEKGESRPRRTAALTAVKKNAQLAEMNLKSKMRNEENVKKRKLLDSDVLDKEKPSKAPRKEEALENTEDKMVELHSTDEKDSQSILHNSVKLKRNKKMNKTTSRRQTKRTASRALTEGDLAKNNSEKSTIGQQLDQRIANEEQSETSESAEAQNQKVDPPVAVQENRSEEVATQKSVAEISLKLNITRSQDTGRGTLESVLEREEPTKQTKVTSTSVRVNTREENSEQLVEDLGHRRSARLKNVSNIRMGAPNDESRLKEVDGASQLRGEKTGYSKTVESAVTLSNVETDKQTPPPSISLIPATLEGRSAHKEVEQSRKIFREPESVEKLIPETQIVEARITRSKMRKIGDVAKENRRTPEAMTSGVPSSSQSTQKFAKTAKTFSLKKPLKQDDIYNCKDKAKNLLMSLERKKIPKGTPLQVKNAIVTPSSGSTRIPLPATKPACKGVSNTEFGILRKEEMRKKQLKEQEVVKKRQEMIKSKQEELKKINEEKMLKAAQLREAAEKEKIENQARIEREREERERLAKAEMEKQKEELLSKKKLQNQQKAQEVEHRRLKEEAARQARLREMEEEKKQEELLRQKIQEERDRVQKQRQKEEELIRQKELQKMKENQQKLKEKYKRKLQGRKELKDKDNYPIDDVSTDDSTDGGEDNGKKDIPLWATSEVRREMLMRQAHVPMDLVHQLFQFPSSTPDLTEFFGKMTMKRIRTSSAVWQDSPPISRRVDMASVPVSLSD